LVVFKGFEDYVHGDGIKYSDYALGAGVKELNPVAIDPKINLSEITPITHEIKISEQKISEVEAAIKEGISRITK
jgi:hypothetical protein